MPLLDIRMKNIGWGSLETGSHPMSFCKCVLAFILGGTACKLSSLYGVTPFVVFTG